MQDITSKQVAAWLREKGNRFIAMADEIESEISSTQSTLYHSNGKVETEHSPRTGNVTIDELQESLRLKSGRVADLANRFNVEPERIQQLIKESHGGVMVAGRGWLKVSQ